MKTIQSLKVPFGLLGDELVEPRAVANGKACECVCPGCKRPLVAYNQGKVRTTQYFGHLPGDECAKGVESAVHLAAKRALQEARWLALPALEVDVDGIAPRAHKPVRVRVVERATTAIYRQVDAEVTLEVEEPPAARTPQGDLFSRVSVPQPTRHVLRPDIKGQRDEHVDWIEVRVTHAVDARKRWLMQQAGLRVIEIDLSSLLRPGITLEEVRDASLNDLGNKTWLAHPRAAEVAAALAAELERESEREALRRARSDTSTSRSPRRWLGDGVEETVFSPAPPLPPPTEEQRLAQLRNELGISPSAPWPRYLDLDLAGNGGCLVSPRLWLTRLYLDWVHGRPGARFLVADLHRSVEKKFGVKPRWGSKDLRRALDQRVLRYWAACGLITVDGEVVVVRHGKK